MKKLFYLSLAFLLTASVSIAAPKGAKSRTFTGEIGDKMCGAKHMMPGAKECTLKCVQGGSQYVLIGPKDKVYDLSDQEKPKAFAGQKVIVSGTLKESTIEVTSIEAAK